MSLVKKRAAGVDNTFRRTWDKNEFEEKAEAREKQENKDEESALDIKRRKRFERDPLHQGKIVQRSSLQQRDVQLDLTSRLGKTQVVTASTPLSQQAGYYCSVCDCILRDSHSYLDHINGKYHNRALGMSMRVERSTADDVRKRFDALKRTKYEGNPAEYVADGFEAEHEKQQKEEEEKRARKRERQRREEAEEAEFEEDEEDISMAMGFQGFGGSRKS